MRQYLDGLVVGVLAMLLLGLVVPFPVAAVEAIEAVGQFAIGLLFFLYGARLATRDVWAGFRNWRLQGAILATTFVLFPLLGLVLRSATSALLGAGFAAGLLYLTLLPSTVQSAVAFVSVARGNVPGAICGATVSNVLGMVLTPVLVALLMPGELGPAGASTGLSLHLLLPILTMLLAPFILGQVLQSWIGNWVRAHHRLTKATDRATIFLIVLGAVARATASGIWADLAPSSVLSLIATSAGLLGTVLALTWLVGRALGLCFADKITLVICGSTKSLSTGLPMAALLLPPAVLGAVVVPVVVFHQLQLVTCSVLARRLATSGTNYKYVS